MNSDVQALIDVLRERVAANADLSGLNLPSLALPSVRLSTQRAPYARIRVGDSRIGGVPDVPPGFQWPRWTSSRERHNKYGKRWHPEPPTPLGFIGQFDLSTIPHVEATLPSSGWLYFFYDRYCEPWGFDPADRGCCRVIYANCERSRLVRMQPPSDGDAEHIAFACNVETWPELTLPDDFPELEYATPAYEAYDAVCHELFRAAGLTQHRLLGHPQLIQNPMEIECQLASNGVYCGGQGCRSEEANALEAGAADWRLLLQIDTDEEGPGWMWGDVGRIYYWIKKQDLASLRFDDVWLILQCC
jgi:uncharacterized protein YwqG